MQNFWGVNKMYFGIVKTVNKRFYVRRDIIISQLPVGELPTIQNIALGRILNRAGTLQVIICCYPVMALSGYKIKAEDKKAKNDSRVCRKRSMRIINPLLQRKFVLVTARAAWKNVCAYQLFNKSTTFFHGLHSYRP